ncbi:UbiD family decarboxylase [Aquisalimonas lutea]|uniref:UbiD family decarboxylase n=1 Tax=Aquisalimonas lutea TaxID=1327750 RepID=UPI0025B4CC62|nr:UbiD family decarboxylase [Aquisalimonas lutea]MDN3516531.1 UbiD family decarboxylase [Aquisalimonas lutea]
MKPEIRPVASLREWLQRLADTDRLGVARRGMPLRYSVAALAKRLDGRKAVLFPEPDGHAIPVVSGLVASRAWIAEAMGTTEAGVLQRFQDAAANPLPWREIETAPVQETVHRDVDLTRLLPVPTHNEHDSGPYITAGLLITRNPRTGVQNVSINRCQINGASRLGVLILPRHAHAFYQEAEAAGDALEVAVVIGVDPLTLLSSQAIVPIDYDELGISGALRGEPLQAVRCVTNEIRVPAEAEIVIEGRLLPDVREPEGPFGEFPQYYGPRGDRHVIEVDAVTHRDKPIFHTIVGGALEHLWLGGIPREATLLGHLTRTFPNVVDVHLPVGGVCRYHLVVQVDQWSQEGQAKNIIMGAFAGHYDIKQVVVVDRDVNIHDPDEVQWAIATRFQASRDLVVVPEAQGSKLDPSARSGVSSKVGIDATVPAGADAFQFTRIRVPGEDSMDVEAHLDGDALNRLREILGRGTGRGHPDDQGG